MKLISLRDAEFGNLEDNCWNRWVNLALGSIERGALSERNSAVIKVLRRADVISQRFERGSIAITSNKAFKQWPPIFNADSTITSAVLNRLLHHAETISIEGSSYRMKDRVET